MISVQCSILTEVNQVYCWTKQNMLAMFYIITLVTTSCQPILSWLVKDPKTNHSINLCYLNPLQSMVLDCGVKHIVENFVIFWPGASLSGVLDTGPGSDNKYQANRWWTVETWRAEYSSHQPVQPQLIFPDFAFYRKLFKLCITVIELYRTVRARINDKAVTEAHIHLRAVLVEDWQKPELLVLHSHI